MSLDLVVASALPSLMAALSARPPRRPSPVPPGPPGSDAPPSRPRVGPQAEARVRDIPDLLAATPSAVTVISTPSGPQRRDSAGQCPPPITRLIRLPGRQSAQIRVDGFPTVAAFVPTTEPAPSRRRSASPFQGGPAERVLKNPPPRSLTAASEITTGPGEPPRDGLRASAVPRLAQSLPSARMLPASGRSTAGGSSRYYGRCKEQRPSVRSWWSAAVSGPAAPHRSAAR